MVADGLIVQTNRGVRVWRLTDKGREEITWESIK
jgi:DNA-binding PadR family transcriptional regulator